MLPSDYFNKKLWKSIILSLLWKFFKIINDESFEIKCFTFSNLIKNKIAKTYEVVGNIHVYKVFTSMNRILTKSQVGQALINYQEAGV